MLPEQVLLFSDSQQDYRHLEGIESIALSMVQNSPHRTSSVDSF